MLNNTRIKNYVNLIHKKEIKITSIKILLLFVSMSLLLLILFISMKNSIHGIHHNYTEQLNEAMINQERLVNKLQAGISQDNIRRWNIISAERVIAFTNKQLPQETVNYYATIIVDESTRHNLDIALVLSLIAQESRFRSNAISVMDAHGLMQVIEETGRWIANELGIVYSDSIRLDPDVSVKMGTWYMNFLLTKYNGSEELALAHYNGGNFNKNAFMFRGMYRNHPEYNRDKIEVRYELLEYRERVNNGELLSKTEMERFTLLRRISSAQNLHPETEAYVPEILNRRIIFRDLMDNVYKITDDGELIE